MKIITKICVILILITLLTSCSENKFLDKPANEYKVTLTYLHKIGGDDIDNDKDYFSTISAIDIDQSNNVHVLDSKNLFIKIFSDEGEHIRTIKFSKGQGPGEFIRPASISLDKKGNYYIGDWTARTISRISKSGKFVNRVKVNFSPADFAVDSVGNIFAVGFGNYKENRIFKYNPVTWKLLDKFCEKAKYSSEIAESGNCGHLEVNKNDEVIFSFFYPYDTRVFTNTGELLKRFQRKPNFYKPPERDKLGVMDCPSGVYDMAVFPDGKILNLVRHLNAEQKICKFYFDIFTKNGKWLANLNATKLSNYIRRVTIDNNNCLYIDCYDPFPHLKKYQITFKKLAKKDMLPVN